MSQAAATATRQTAAPQASSHGELRLQRTCACGQHAAGSSPCDVCPRMTCLPAPSRGEFGGRAAVAPSVVRDVVQSPGRPLNDATRTFMETRFGQNFSRVRLHTDTKAATSARSLGAAAYTVGSNVVFGLRQYTPATISGQKLIAHELTHVVQQRMAHLQPGMQLAYSTVGSGATEIEAERIGSVVISGGQVPTISQFPAPIEHLAVLQRQEICEPQAETPSPTTPDAIFDYENQVCRPPYPDEVASSVPAASSVDSEFWILPAGVRLGAKPIFDDQGTGVIVGFHYSSGGYYEVYDLEGQRVEVGEPGLQTPLIDPIDFLAGGLTGLARGLFRGGVGAVATGVARGGGTALVRAGLVVTLRSLSRRAVTAVRGVYRTIRSRGALNFTGTTVARMADPARRVPHHILKLALRFGTRSPDPQGVPGAFRYVIPMFRNGRQYTLEVVFREADSMVLHFLYR